MVKTIDMVNDGDYVMVVGATYYVMLHDNLFSDDITDCYVTFVSTAERKRKSL